MKWIIPEINLSEIVGDHRPLLPEFDWTYEDGGLNCHELINLLMIAVHYQPVKLLEIGTFMGMTTRALAECLPYTEIHTVDLPLDATVQDVPGQDKHLVDRRDVGREFRGRPCALRITQHFHDTLTWDFVEVGFPTFFFIDGSHTYEGVRNDSDKCWRRAMVGSVFIWHDCDARHPGVVQLLSEWRMMERDLYQIVSTNLAYMVKRYPR